MGMYDYDLTKAPISVFVFTKALTYGKDQFTNVNIYLSNMAKLTLSDLKSWMPITRTSQT